MAKATTLIGGVLLAVASAGVGWSLRALAFPSAENDEDASGDEEAAPEISPGAMLVHVATAEVVRGDLSLVVPAAGVVEAAPMAERVLSSRASGRVLETFAAIGQEVEQGDVLLRFETAPLEAALAQSRAALAKADAELADFERTRQERQTVELDVAAKRAATVRELADAQLARILSLQKDGLASDKALAEAQQSAEQARADQEQTERAAAAFRASGAELQHATLLAERDAAEAAVGDAERVLAESELRSVAAGRITRFDARAGEKLEPGAAIGALLVSDRRVVRFAVASSAAPGLAIGAPASWEDAGGAGGSGKVARIAGEVDLASGLVDVLVEPDPKVRSAPPGSRVRGALEIELLKDVVLVPERAVMRAHDEQVVVLATAEGTAKVVPVKLLGRNSGVAAIEGEVSAGARAIVEGGYNLPDGARVVDTAAQVGGEGRGSRDTPPGDDGK